MSVERTVQTSVGPVTVTLWGGGKGVVSAEGLTVNRVAGLTVRADIRPAKVPVPVPGKEYVNYEPIGAPHVEHLAIRKEGDWQWEPSWAMRDKVSEIALAAFTSLAEDPATSHLAEVDRAEGALSRAEAAEAQARAALAEAEATTAAAREALASLQAVTA